MKQSKCKAIFGLCIGAVVAASVGAPAFAQSGDGESAASAAQPNQPPSSAPEPQPATSADFAARSDAELTALTARWGELNPAQRRQLLAEVRSRMARTNSANARGLLGARGGSVKVRVQRRYGRVVRKSDGRVVMRTRVVEVGPKGQRQRGRVTFGIGFEQRSRSRVADPATAAASEEAQSPPTVTVSRPASSE